MRRVVVLPLFHLPLERTRIVDIDDINNRFDYHRPDTDEKVNAHETVRRNCRALATYLNSSLPEGREKSLAITHLEEVMMWANAAIARS